MTNYRPIDSKREEFRKYLERAGVMESLTRVLVSLYEESDKGMDALEYLRNHLVEDEMKAQNSTEDELKSQIEALLSENRMLRKRLSQYEEVQPSTVVLSHTPKRSDATSEHSKTSGSSKNDQPDQQQSVSSSSKST